MGGDFCNFSLVGENLPPSPPIFHLRENPANTTNISSFCKIQHLKYLAHVTRLENSSLQKQLLFSTTQKKYARDPWLKAEKDLNISKMQIQKEMQNKTKFMSLLHLVYN